jgi:hypothetical protein
LKTKFISVILSVAVMLSLMVAVPAVPTALAAGPVWCYEIQPNMTKVGFNTDFNVTVRALCSPGPADTWNIMVDFDPTYLQVIGITRANPLPNPPDNSAPDGYPGEPTLNNTDGWVFDGYGTPPGKATVNASFDAWTIHFRSNNATTSGTYLNFVTVTPYYSTMAILAGSDYLDWNCVVNGTVKIGSPTLTVNVDPAGKGTVNQVPSGPYSWDQVVNLTAVNSTAGWGWASWSGADNNAVNPTTVTMSTDKTVTATFVELPPKLSVSPLSLAFSARYGNKTDNKTVTISNTGGGTLCWAVGTPPVWTIGDNWNYNYIYQPFAPAWAPLVPGANASLLTQTVTGYGSNYQCAITITPAARRSMMGGMPCVLWNATVLVDEYTLDYVNQLGYMSIYPYAGGGNFTPVSVIANLTWVYAGCHGWPYYLGKTWSYNLTMDVKTTGGSPVDYKVHPCMAVVTAWNSTMGAWEITHLALPNMTPFMQTWWSPTVRNFVLTADGGAFDFPPMDIRSLAGFSVAAPAPAAPPAWVSFDKTHGSLGISGSEVLTATASSSGLAVGNYTGSFDISAAGSIQVKTVNVSLVVLPATTIDVIRNLPADALDLDAEYPGDTFDVWVNFTAPIDNFNAIGLTDLAPAGWAVQTNTAWCDPVASWTKGEGNKAEYSWSGPYANGVVFHAMYKVTIPATAANGLNTWPNNDGSKAWAEYWFGAQGPYMSAVTGEFEKIVTVPGKIWGETREVNAALLTTTLVVCDENPAQLGDEPEDSDSSTAPDAIYSLDVDDTGQYYMTASKYCWFDLNTSAMPTPRNPSNPLYIDLGNTAKLAAGCNLDFEGDYGLVPKACTMSYAMMSVNHWLFIPINGGAIPHPEWQLSVWKAMESVHSWQFPTGCNT